MLLQDLIRRVPATLPPHASCEAAARLMRDANVGAVVVAEAARPLGLVTDRDLAVRVIGEGLDPTAVKLADVMSSEPIFLSRQRSVASVLDVMRQFGIRRVMVVDDAGALIGVVAMDDLLIHLAGELAAVAAVIRTEIGA